MKHYPLHRNRQISNLLEPVSTFLSEEGCKHIYGLYLSEEIEGDKYGNTKATYRLHATDAHNIEMALAYDINCPKCGKRLKQIGRCLSYHDLGLYECPECKARRKAK